ncbi:hypothetical protein [Cupriavidus sp. L7L]|uniref:hypothetical protein n=1 Tax=Cupriavidus sp. L7L TaxID=2546443 RepID=UPI0010560836|nr:hypothetical protein [Cupriavidus sp. L7L]TDF67921.1 hypothetical protein E1J61_00845 [Cupriavidus sp. L7L]
MYIVDFSFSWRRNLVGRTDVWPVARRAGLAAAHNFFAAYSNLTRYGVTAWSVIAALRCRISGQFRTVTQRWAAGRPMALHDGPATGRMRDCLKIEHHAT